MADTCSGRVRRVLCHIVVLAVLGIAIVPAANTGDTLEALEVCQQNGATEMLVLGRAANSDSYQSLAREFAKQIGPIAWQEYDFRSLVGPRNYGSDEIVVLKLDNSRNILAFYPCRWWPWICPWMRTPNELQ